MDQQNYAADMVATPWDEGPADRIEQYASNLASRAHNLGHMVTHPGGESDMNAPLVNSVRQAALLEVHLDLGYLANDVRKMLAQQKSEAERSAQRAAMTSYGQGVADGVEKGKDYHAREVADAEARSLHGNPAAVRELAPVLTSKGHVAAWKIVHEDPDGTTFAREVYGTLADDVREGDTRAVVQAGPDRLLVGLDRVRFAGTLHALVAERDTADLVGVELLSFGTYRAQDSMDGSARLDVQITEMTEDEAAQGCKAGTYVRVQTAENNSGEQRVTVDLTLAQWNSLADAVETLYARHLVRREKDAEK
jgi:hypothetical protein